MRRWHTLWLWALLGGACGADPCEGVPCSEGRACVVRERKARCEPLDAGMP